MQIQPLQTGIAQRLDHVWHDANAAHETGARSSRFALIVEDGDCDWISEAQRQVEENVPFRLQRVSADLGYELLSGAVHLNPAERIGQTEKVLLYEVLSAVDF